MLAMGGNALGLSVKSSGLLEQIDQPIKTFLKEKTQFVTFLIVTGIVCFVTNFISHTVGAILFSPVAYQIGLALPNGNPNLLLMGTGIFLNNHSIHVLCWNGFTNIFFP